jgi:triphosphatase
MLRDVDVMISGIMAPMETVASNKSGFAELRAALVRDRREKRDEVRAALRSPAWTKLQLYLTLGPSTLKESAARERPITKHARKVLRKAWRKSAELGQNLKRLDAEQRHEMSKALKNLRYQAEFFARLFKRRDTRRFIEQLKTLQDVFGYINDVRITSRLLEVQKLRNAGIDAARAAAHTIGRHEAEAAHVGREAPKAWKDLERSPRFWA